MGPGWLGLGTFLHYGIGMTGWGKTAERVFVSSIIGVCLEGIERGSLDGLVMDLSARVCVRGWLCPGLKSTSSPRVMLSFLGRDTWPMIQWNAV